MSTYAQIKARIADDLSRSDLTTQIAQAVLDAIVDQERTRFYFNERRDAPAFTTVADQELYTASDDADIATVAHIDTLVVIQNGSRLDLTARNEQWLDERMYSGTFTGKPTDYSYLAKRIRFYPIPDAAYQIYMTAQIRLPALSADGDSNAWTTDAELLTLYGAKEKLYRHTIQDKSRADGMAAEVAKQRDLLLTESTSRGGPMRIRGTCF
jgi:hypothetical protein